MKKIIIVALAILVSATFSVNAKDKKEKAAEKPVLTDTLSYAVGVQTTMGLVPFLERTYDFTTLDLDVFLAGFADALKNDTTLFTVKSAREYIDAEKERITREQFAGYIAEQEAFLAANAQNDSVVVLPSGLQYKVIVMGDGPIAKERDNVTVRYEGKMTDGTVFDSSYTRTPDTSSFRASQVIKGWSEALQLMPEGSTWQLFIPAELAYGERQAGQIRPYSALIFTVEVVKVGN